MSAQVASFVKMAFNKPFKGENLREHREKFTIPSNIDCMGVSKVNKPIYLKLCATAKNKDRASQVNQISFMKVVSGLVRMTENLMEHEKEHQWIKDTLELGADSITLAASIQSEWMQSRREDIKPTLPDKYKRLVAVEVPLTSKNLFGDEVDLEGFKESVEKIKTEAKKKVKKPTRRGGVSFTRRRENQGLNNDNKKTALIKAGAATTTKRLQRQQPLQRQQQDYIDQGHYKKTKRVKAASTSIITAVATTKTTTTRVATTVGSDMATRRTTETERIFQRRESRN